jgi:hypothetical protein
MPDADIVITIMQTQGIALDTTQALRARGLLLALLLLP